MSSRLSSKIAAVALALFMLTNAVVLSGELVGHALHDDDSTMMHHAEAPHASASDSPSSLDCKDHYGCHSHSPMSVGAATLLLAMDAAPKWSLLAAPVPARLSQQPPVPPPTQIS